MDWRPTFDGFLSLDGRYRLRKVRLFNVKVKPHWRLYEDGTYTQFPIFDTLEEGKEYVEQLYRENRPPNRTYPGTAKKGPIMTARLEREWGRTARGLTVSTLPKAIDEFERGAIDYTQKAQAHWKEQGQLDMIRAEKEDFLDIKKVIGLLRHGKYTEAFTAAQRLDTFVREQIPTPIWDFMSDDDDERWDVD